MIYLRTGGNGAGKTLLTLKEVRELSVKESRPVAYNGRFALTADFGWKKIDAKDWQAEPDGTIFLFDECHNDFPVRVARGEPPAHVAMLAEHRRRGFDFFLITQHPMNIDAFVRRIIAAPGWHQHLKRKSKAMVSVTEWAEVNPNCEKPGASESGQIKLVGYPKEVFEWYESTSLDTAKPKVPWQVKMFIASLLAVPLLGWYGWHVFKTTNQKTTATPAATGQTPAPVAPERPQTAAKVQTPAEYVAALTPRIEGFPQTAPRYDDVTKPTTAPYPAACVSMKPRCQCYSQQGTKLEVPMATCLQIVEKGFFVDWQNGPTNAAQPVNHSIPAPAQGQQVAAATVPVAIGMQAGVKASP